MLRSLQVFKQILNRNSQLKVLLSLLTLVLICTFAYYSWVIKMPVTYQPALVESLNHPTLFFNSIKETPGWRYMNSSPYKEWRKAIIEYSERVLLKWDPSGSNVKDPDTWEFIKAQYTEWLALTYLITNDERYAKKCIEAFQNYGKGIWNPEKPERLGKYMAKALLHYSIAYDWIANYVRSKDLGLDRMIRDNLAKTADYLLSGLSDWSNVHDRINIACGLGVASLTLADYKSPYKTGPLNWLKVAVEYLCKEDPDIGYIPMLQGYGNPGGVWAPYGYHYYFTPELCIWLNAYNHFYNRSLAEEYPILRKFLNAEIWMALPNGMGPSLCTSDNVYWGHSYLILNVLPLPDRMWHMWRIVNYLGLDGPKVKPVWGIAPRLTEIPNAWMLWLFILYDKYAVKPRPPDWTTFISSEAEAVVFRSGWTRSSDYLYLKIPNHPVPTWRVMMHHDSMSFEYYSKGDLLLCDSGEVKHWVPGYGPVYAKGHNTVMISNRVGGHMGGPVKGNFTHYWNPIVLRNFLVRPYFEFVEAVMDWRYIESQPEGEKYYVPELLKNPVKWHRVILYPVKEYFIIVDILKGSQVRDIDLLLHLSSLNIVESKGSTYNVTYKGYVIGNLTVEGKSVNWVSQPYGEEVYVGTGNLAVWTTQNISGMPIKLYIFSAPKSKITVERFWCRIGGYSLPNEVTHPILRFKLTASTMYRITILYTSFPHEEDINISEIQAENGTAVRFLKGKIVDLVYAGNGFSSIGNMKTDSNILFYRSIMDKPNLLAAVRVSYIIKDQIKLFEFSKPVEFLFVIYSEKTIRFAVNGTGEVSIKMYAPGVSEVKVNEKPIPFKVIDDYIIIKVKLPKVQDIEVTISNSN